jgi:hypothetical protein
MLAPSAMAVVIALGEAITPGTRERVTAEELLKQKGIPEVPQRRA